jgi:hypothetical protein
MYFEADGTIGYRMQWGSNSDVRNGDGLVFSEDFPFRCKVSCSVLNSTDVIVDNDSIEVETDEHE